MPDLQRLQITNAAKQFVAHLSLLITESTLYPNQHPKVISQIKQTFGALEEALQLCGPFYIDVAEKQFEFEGIPFYELRRQAEKAAVLLSGKNIESLYFTPGVTPQELAHFVQLLGDKARGISAQAMRQALPQAGVHHISLARLEPEKAAAEGPKIAGGGQLYAGSIEANKLVYQMLQAGESVPMDVVEKVAHDITTMMTRNVTSGLALAALRDYDDYTFTHSTNVAILSVALAGTIYTDQDLLQRLAKAALLHDIGKTKIPKEIVNKPGKLNDEEWQMMRQHPMFGVSILEQQGTADDLAILITAQHHMKYDMTGYPQVAGMEAIHPLSQIVTVCDIYDAITARRVYKAPLPPDKALALLMRLVGCDINPQFFKQFVQLVGVYPPGSFVRLSSGEIAVVTAVRPTLLLQPLVNVITDRNGTPLETPRPFDLAAEANTTLRIEQPVDPVAVKLDPLKYIV